MSIVHLAPTKHKKIREMASLTNGAQLINIKRKAYSYFSCESNPNVTESSSTESTIICQTCDLQKHSLAEAGRQITSLHREKNSRNVIIEEFANLIADLRDKNGALELRVQSLTSENVTLNAEIDGLTKSNAALTDQVTDLKMKIADVVLKGSLQADELSLKIENLENEIWNLKEAKRTNEESIGDLYFQLETKSTAISSMGQQIKDTKKAYDELFEKFESQQEMVEQLQFSLTFYHEHEKASLIRHSVDFGARAFFMEEVSDDEFVSCDTVSTASDDDTQNESPVENEKVATFKKVTFTDEVVEKLKNKIRYLEVENENLKRSNLDVESEIKNLKHIKESDDKSIQVLTGALEAAEKHLNGLDVFLLETSTILKKHGDIQLMIIPQLMKEIESLKVEKQSLLSKIGDTTSFTAEIEKLRQEKINDFNTICHLTRQLEIFQKSPPFNEKPFQVYNLDRIRMINGEHIILQEGLKSLKMKEREKSAKKTMMLKYRDERIKVFDLDLFIAVKPSGDFSYM